MRHVTLVPAMLILFVAGCGSTGSSVEEPPRQLSYDEYFSAGQSIAVQTRDAPASDPGALPVTGSTQYVGVVALQTEGVSTLLGDFSMGVEFAGAGTITGAAQNFVSEDAENYDGVLDISGGSFSRAVPAGIAALTDVELTGILTGPQELGVEAQFDVTFYGDNAEFIVGDGNSGLVYCCGGTFAAPAVVSVAAQQQ